MPGPAAGPVRVLVIAADPARRRLIREVLAGDDRLAIVAMAADLAEARAQLDSSRAEVVLADGQGPVLSDLWNRARARGVPVLPVVSLGEAQTGAHAVEVAGDEGRANAEPAFVTAPLSGLGHALVMAVRLAASTPAGAPRRDPHPAYRWNGRHLLIGASTGGVDALTRILAELTADCPPTVIVQHMPEAFLASFAQRLDGTLAPQVRLADDGARLRQGLVLIAPGGDRHLQIGGRTRLHCSLVEGAPRNGHRPSIDVAFESARQAAASVVAVLLTGMGRDGADGLRRLREGGARTLAQDQASSVVWGMPGAAWTEGGAEELVDLDRIGSRLIALCSRDTEEGGKPPRQAERPGVPVPPRLTALISVPPRPDAPISAATRPLDETAGAGPRGAVPATNTATVPAPETASVRPTDAREGPAADGPADGPVRVAAPVIGAVDAPRGGSTPTVTEAYRAAAILAWTAAPAERDTASRAAALPAEFAVPTYRASKSGTARPPVAAAPPLPVAPAPGRVPEAATGDGPTAHPQLLKTADAPSTGPSQPPAATASPPAATEAPPPAHPVGDAGSAADRPAAAEAKRQPWYEWRQRTPGAP